MNWGNTKESTTELLLTIGTTIIVLGFIQLLKLRWDHIIIAGVIITAIGVLRANKNLKDKGIIPDWKKRSRKKVNKK